MEHSGLAEIEKEGAWTNFSVRRIPMVSGNSRIVVRTTRSHRWFAGEYFSFLMETTLNTLLST